VIKTCANPWCQQSFAVTNEDLLFYEKISPVFGGKKYMIPPPTQCPECRQREQWAMRNECHLYHRQCSQTGKNILSLYPADSRFVVLSEEAYRSDQWEAREFGILFNANENFFKNYEKVLMAVPRRALHKDDMSKNCEYITYGSENKNCYMVFSCFYSSDIFHCRHSAMLTNSSDCFQCVGGELLYDCVDCTQCYNCFFCKDAHDCHDSYIVEDCQHCSHCIACKNLRHKEYYYFNEPIDKDTFNTLKDRLLSSDNDIRKKFSAWKQTQPYPASHCIQAENSTGDYLHNVNRCSHCFDLHMGAEDCQYCVFGGKGLKDAQDCIICGVGSELLYRAIGTGPANRCAFVSICAEANDCLYCTNCNNCSFCFGCAGLKNQQYCILNKQYTKEEYEQLVPQIILHMQQTREWGQFFPISISPFAYNETVAQEYSPLTKEEVLQRGWKWRDQIDEIPAVDRVIPAAKLPDSIDDVPDDVLNWAIECETTKRPFRIIAQELNFYRKMRLPIPHLHPNERHKRRMALRNPRKLWTRTCGKCGKEIQTTYDPERPEKVLCEECYLKEVY
jgi:hypothetical protein